MFTGLIEETGTVIALEGRTDGGARLTLRAEKIDAVVGDSIAVNGCCLTVTQFAARELTFDLLAETLRLTNLKSVSVGSLVNLERALPATGRIGGHFVQGHIDGAARVLSFEKIGADHRLELELPSEFSKFAASKGSIAVDGVSLTVAEVLEKSFVLWIIPHTLAETNLRELRMGNSVNLEFDILAKYVERLMGGGR